MGFLLKKVVFLNNCDFNFKLNPRLFVIFESCHSALGGNSALVSEPLTYRYESYFNSLEFLHYNFCENVIKFTLDTDFSQGPEIHFT